MGNITFSVLIPVYNVEKFLTQCVESVLNQTYQNFEIILINDGSNDSSGFICDEFSKKNIKIKTIHQANQGLIMARRNAINNARGDYCLFLDSDDYWDLNLLETVHETIIECECDLVIYKYKRVLENQIIEVKASHGIKDKTIFDCQNKQELFKKIISSSDLNNLVCKAVKRSIIDKTDYSQFKNIRNAEDLLQSIPLLYNAEKIVYIDKPLYNYRIVLTSMTQIFNPHFYEDITVVRGVLLDYLYKLQMNSEENLELFYNFYINIITDSMLVFLTSSLENGKKILILDWIQNTELYISSLNYFNKSNLGLDKNIRFYLFKNKQYSLLGQYANVLLYLKSMRNTLKKIRGYKHAK